MILGNIELMCDIIKEGIAEQLNALTCENQTLKVSMSEKLLKATPATAQNGGLMVTLELGRDATWDVLEGSKFLIESIWDKVRITESWEWR